MRFLVLPSYLHHIFHLSIPLSFHLSFLCSSTCFYLFTCNLCFAERKKKERKRGRFNERKNKEETRKHESKMKREYRKIKEDENNNRFFFKVLTVSVVDYTTFGHKRSKFELLTSATLIPGCGKGR